MHSKLFRKLLLLFLTMSVLLSPVIVCKEGKEIQKLKNLLGSEAGKNSTGSYEPEIRIY